MTPILLEVDDLSVVFKTSQEEVAAVKNLSFTINQGEILGIVGESGSGKSVTAMAIMRLLQCPPAKISSGRILFSTHSDTVVDIIRIAEKDMRKLRGRDISMVFQEPMTSLNPVYRCGEQVREVILEHQKISKRDAEKKVKNFFEEVLLPRPSEIYKAYPHQLSGGQKQRVMIAMALANNPKLIIADEPTTALDVTVQKTILELLKNIKNKFNVSIIFISHDLNVVSEIADKLIVMYKGGCVESNCVKELFKNPLHPYTKGLMACRPRSGKRLKILPTVNDFLNNIPDGLVNNFSDDIISSEERKEVHKRIYSDEPLIQVQGLNMSFVKNRSFFSAKPEYFHVLKNISFDVYKGETLGLVGESGCGKTTLGRAILRLIEPSSGTVFYKKNNITQLSKYDMRQLRRRLQIIFQDPYSSLNPRMTIGEAIAEPIRAHNLARNKKECLHKVINLLEKVGLNESQYNRYPHEFSGGQRQRIVIARTLALEPEFIICDESVSALDVSIQAQVLNLLNKLKNEFGLTYIFISHDLSVVRYLSDRILIMKEGEIIESGEADGLYLSPKEPYTKKLIEAIPGKQK